MRKQKMKCNVISVLLIGSIFVLFFAQVSVAEEYSYREPPIISPTLSNSGDKLYLSYYSSSSSDLIVEIDVSTMQEIRSFNIAGPGFIALSPDGNYLYTDSIDKSSWPTSYMVRINLNDGQIDQIALDGEIMRFTQDDNGDWIWVVHRTYPYPGGYVDEHEAWQDYNDSGHITRINADNFVNVGEKQTSIFPMSVWYSEYSDQIFISHEFERTIEGDKGDEAGVVIYTCSGDLSQENRMVVGGKHQNTCDFPTVGCNWSDDGRYFVCPSSAPQRSFFSLRVIDSYDNSIFFDMVIPKPSDGTAISINYVKKVPGSNILWALTNWGEPENDKNRMRVAYRINTLTQGYERFDLPEVTSPVGFFDVSSDGRTLYITKPYDGSLVITSPGNHNPVCDLLVITPRPHTGPSPVAIEFDASGTYDDDGDTLTFHWDFDGDKVFDEPIDDAYTGDPSNPTHEYTADYEGPVNLRVTDNYQGECDTAVILSVDVQ